VQYTTHAGRAAKTNQPLVKYQGTLFKIRIVFKFTQVLFLNSLIDCGCIVHRVSFETSFDSKQPKLEPKLVSALSETKRLFRLFRFHTETEIFDVSIEPKQTEAQPKQGAYFVIFYRKLWLFPVFFVPFLFPLELFLFSPPLHTC
jgi:hypothetical protein